MSTSSTHGSSNTSATGLAAKNPALAAVALGALGVVFGDIGTSPLYAFKAGFVHAVPSAVTHDVVFGLISVFFWTLIIVIGVKYARFILRADNNGEGGIFALLSMLPRADEATVFKLPKYLLVLGVVGASLLYADGLITPAISVLSALEGLYEFHPTTDPILLKHREHLVMGLSVALLIGLFVMQRMGSAFLGRLFGPVMVVWFSLLGVLGFFSLIQTPEALQALNPIYIVKLFAISPLTAMTVLGAAMLCISGGEALYADLGQFGRRPVLLCWYLLVLPGLLLNYLGQGALMMRNPEAISNPFYGLVPTWGIVPMVVVATAATIVASQSIITGMFALTHSAILMGLLPRLRVVYTSDNSSQIYVPAVNLLALIAVAMIVINFRNSDNLEHAYGLAVAGDMAITTFLFAVLMVRHRGWGMTRSIIFCGFFLSIDLMFFGASILKVPSGGWFTLVVAGALTFVMLTWVRGRKFMIERYEKHTLDYAHLLNNLQTHPVPRVAGTGVFLTPQSSGVPPTLLHHLKHNKALHEQVVVMSVQVAPVPRVDPEAQVELKKIGDDFWIITARHGFLQSADVPRMLRIAGEQGLETSEGSTTYYLGRTVITPRGRAPMPGFQKRIFCALAQISSNNPLYFSIPPGRMVELGIQVDV